MLPVEAQSVQSLMARLDIMIPYEFLPLLAVHTSYFQCFQYSDGREVHVVANEHKRALVMLRYSYLSIRFGLPLERDFRYYVAIPSQNFDLHLSKAIYH